MHLTAFDDSQALAEWLAEHVAGRLRSAIESRGNATLAVSGGSTPRMFFKTLSAKELDWEKVCVTLVDERWVATSSNRSNQKLVTIDLLQDKAAKAGFLSLYQPDREPHEVRLIEKDLRALLPLDVVVLGMGNDGHTASLFPGGDNLALATRDDCDLSVVEMNAPDAAEPRVTLTLPVICGARDLVLHIEGDEKREVLDDASETLDPAKLPIAHVISKCPDLRVVWAP